MVFTHLVLWVLALGIRTASVSLGAVRAGAGTDYLQATHFSFGGETSVASNFPPGGGTPCPNSGYNGFLDEKSAKFVPPTGPEGTATIYPRACYIGFVVDYVQLMSGFRV